MKIRPRENLTTEQGAPVAGNLNSLSAGQRDPVFLQDIHLIEKQEMTL